MTRSVLCLLVGLAALALLPSSGIASELVSARPALLSFQLCQAAPSIAEPTPVASWTLLGCWRSRPWVTTCFDVFRDEAGGLHICKACGTTGSPNKGKCRPTTQAELDGGTWCSATE